MKDEIDELIKDAYVGFEAAISSAKQIKDSKEADKLLTRAQIEGLELVIKAIDRGYIPGTRKIKLNETRNCMEDPGQKLIYLSAFRRELAGAVQEALSVKSGVYVFEPLPVNSQISEWTICASKELQLAVSRYGQICMDLNSKR